MKMTKKVISFSLWGDKTKYTHGALNNAIYAKTIYPEWTLRMYVREDVPFQIVEKLNDLGVEIVPKPLGGGDWRGLFWRFEVADDPDVSRFIIRDTDSIVNWREKAAVDEWIESGQAFHCMRDNVAHNKPILGGMWGSVGGVLSNVTTSYESYCKHLGDNIGNRGPDQVYLEKFIWPLVKKHHIAHDNYFTYSGTAQRPFPKHTEMLAIIPPYVGSVCVDWYEILADKYGIDWKTELIENGLYVP